MKRLHKMLVSPDGGYSIPRVVVFSGFLFTTLWALVIGIGMAAFGWNWTDWNGYFTTVASVLFGGGVAGNALHRATYNPKAEDHE